MSNGTTPTSQATEASPTPATQRPDSDAETWHQVQMGGEMVPARTRMERVGRDQFLVTDIFAGRVLDPKGECRLYALLLALFGGADNIPLHLRPLFPPRPLALESRGLAA